MTNVYLIIVNQCEIIIDAESFEDAKNKVKQFIPLPFEGVCTIRLNKI